MKENVFDVLMYLFENYMDEGTEFQPDQEALTHELTRAGFRRGEIRKAFNWLDGLSALRDNSAGQPRQKTASAIRHYTPHEQEKMDEECRGYLQFMETSGVIDPATRELVIDRLMALEADEIALDQLKWIMLLVLFNQPGQEYAYHMLEDMVFDEMQGHLH
ncbi:MAG: Smg family protein [Sulfuricaulis sp.]